VNNHTNGTPVQPTPQTSNGTRRWCCALALASTTLLSACAVGPDFMRPLRQLSESFSPSPLPESTATSPLPGGEAQRFVATKDIQADWWTLFESPALNSLIEKAFAANPTLEAAQASLRAAQANVSAQRGFFYPTVQLGYSPSRTKLAGNLGGNSPGVQGDGSEIKTYQGTPASQGGSAPYNGPVIYNFHTAQMTVGYVPDVFGINRRLVESLAAQTRIQHFQLEAAYITLATNVVAAAIQEALLREQIGITKAIIAANEQSVDLVNRQLKAGFASRLDLALQESALAQSRQVLPPLQKQFEQNRHLLRALAGGVQDSELPETFDLASLKLPQELPLSLPSQIIEQRPDVRAAEEQLHATTAQLGVAIANRLPQFAIDATWGGAASHFSQMFWNSGLLFNLAASITQTVFDGGTLKYRQTAMEEGVRQMAAQYQSTVITAFQNVADTLYAVHADAEAFKASADVERTTKIAMELMRNQHTRGYIDRLALINAEQTYRQASLSLAQARATRLGDTAALFQSLGGGWWNKGSTSAVAGSTATGPTQPEATGGE
jgi:NodT family efflux transporter outer membrane factor (OMF) lipoprotein